MTTRQKQKPKFIQIVSAKCLTALDEKGDCWLYQGDRYGWSPLNMRRLTVSDTIKIREERRGGQGYVPTEDELNGQGDEDDIPFN